MSDIENGKTDEAVGGGPDGEIYQAEAFTMKTWNADCPYCGNIVELGGEPSVGDEIICMECEKVFSIGSTRDTN